jgi:hypothetical protein
LKPLFRAFVEVKQRIQGRPETARPKNRSSQRPDDSRDPDAGDNGDVRYHHDPTVRKMETRTPVMAVAGPRMDRSR